MSPELEFTLGVDLSEQSFDAGVACREDEPKAWRRLPHEHIAHSPLSDEGIEELLRWVSEQPGRCRRVVVESTGQLSKRFARAIRGRGLPEVCIINPRLSRAYGISLGVREKSDRIDSVILALYGANHRCEPVETGSPAEERLRGLTRLRQSFVEEVTVWKNRLRETDELRGRKIIEKTIRHLEKQIQELDQSIEQEIAADSQMAFQVQSLKQIKGIKQIASTTLTAELGDLRKYDRNQLIGRVGLFAKIFESGTSVRKPKRLAKGGCASVRRVLYMSATSILRSKGPLRLYAEQLRQHGLREMDILMNLMRKILLICRAVMINKGKYDENLILRGTRP